MFSWLLPKKPTAIATATLVDNSGGGAGASSNEADYRPLTTAQRRSMASRPPSFTELLPWRGFDADPKAQVFELSDGVSVGALFELTPAPTEAQPQELLNDCRRKVQGALQGLPESETAEWIVQFFLNDDRNIDHLRDELEAYIDEVHASNPERREAVKKSVLTETVVNEFALHLGNVSRAEGLFVDTEVSGHVWRGQIRRVRCCLYRIYKANHDFSREPGDPTEMLNRVAEGMVANLEEAGVRVRRGTGKDLYDWLLPFFNRRKDFRTPGDLLRAFPYPGDESPQSGAPIAGWDLSSFLNLANPKTNQERGQFEFDGVPVKALTLQQITSNPEVGHLSAERQYGRNIFARFDRLPANAMLSVTVVIRPQNLMEEGVERIKGKSKAKSPEAERTYAECDRILKHMAGTPKDKLFPTFTVLYLSAETEEQLRKDIATVNAQLGSSGLRFISPEHDLTPIDAFVRGLPMCFDPSFDAQRLKRSRLLFASQVAALLPVYGRQRGSGRPGFPFWNRGGEPMWVDPLNKRDRKKNAHMLVLGPTGAGKSSTLNFLVLFMMAIHRPRLFIADAGKSFGLLKDYFASMGLTTNYVELTPYNDVSLPPFALAAKLLADPSVMDSFQAVEDSHEEARLEAIESAITAKAAEAAQAIEDEDDSDSSDDSPEKDQEQEKRDYLGEMLLSAIMMITGGEEQEIAKMSRADRYVISRAIIKAALAAQKAGKPHPLVQDVALALMGMNKDETLLPDRKKRAAEMGEAMMVFTQSLRGKLFNRYGQKWPDADVTLVEMGTLTQDGYEDALAVAYTGLIDHVHATGEAHQHEGRDNIFLTDEGHLITTNPLLGPKIAKGTKMWRKLSIWFWLATQDMKDFPNSMSRVLNMCEYWLLLTMEMAEVEEVSRFKKLTAEERKLMESTRKEPPKYTEGVLLSSTIKALFRNVPPPIAIALAMTEGHEKAARKRLMQQHNCTEMEAAVLVARQLAERRV
ncbi:MAG: conjugative transfer ATPase [Burkholderiales bacterium]|nr:MAG: conjugative transfer ATPase [Burkholderiales bacterium]